ALRSHLYTLRKAIDKPFDTPLLQTVQGMGYRLALEEDG
ncbi:MAG: helix-turn-helix domain-containing protein, partial [Gammaproteobacteria bacterium]|nr:helix-turn-helix domain-containing protein [Gammaproteobacteria bacterium]